MLVRKFKEDNILRENARLINTIHDSVMVDCRAEHKDYAAAVMKEVMEGVVGEMKTQWDLFFDLPLRVEVESGSCWGNTTRLI